MKCACVLVQNKEMTAQVLAVQSKIICAVCISICRYLYLCVITETCLLATTKNQILFILSLYIVQLKDMRLLQNIVYFAVLANDCGWSEFGKTIQTLFTVSWLGIQSVNQLI